jgi:tripartite-type tricarboxylate transporter receptor subunit TctC
VVVENRGGAGDSNAHSVNPAIYAKLPYDTVKDFTDIVPLAIQPNVLVVSANSPYKNLMDLVNDAKAKPGAINWGHAGIGSGTHLNTERFLAASGIKVTQVPFKGTPEVFAAMFSGDVNAYWAPISAAMSSIKGGKLRPLAVSTAKRNPTMPDIPTTGEAGVKGADSPLWFGVWGPAGLPAEIVSKVNADVRRALQDATVKERLQNGGNETMDMAPQEFARFVRSEIDVYQKVIKDAGIKPQ